MPHTKEIYLIRHGETDYNKRGIVQGSGIDSSLNEKGLAQAAAFFEHYKDIKFSRVYTSELKRTIQTVSGFTDLGIPHTILPGFNEISWGDKEGKVPTPEDAKYYRNLVLEWKKGNEDEAAKGGESPKEVKIRQQEALRHILEQKDEDIILIAMHGRAMRILLAQISNLPNSMMDLFQHENLCLYKLTYNYNNHEYKIIDSCNLSHLKNLTL